MARMRGPDYGSMLRAIYEPKLQRQTAKENFKLKQATLNEQIAENLRADERARLDRDQRLAIAGSYAEKAEDRFKSEGDARSHDILMQKGRFGHDLTKQGRGFAHDLSMLDKRFAGEGGLIDRRFGHQKGLKRMDQAYDWQKTTTGREFQAGMQDERLQSTENIALMNDVTKRYGIDVSADVARDGYVSQENIAKLREAGMDERLIKTLDTKTQMQQRSFDHALDMQGRGFGQERDMFALGSQLKHGLLDKELASREGIAEDQQATTRYGVDKSLEGTKYVADTGAESRETVAKIGQETQLGVAEKQTSSAESIAKMRELGQTARTAMNNANAKDIAELPYKTGPIDEGDVVDVYSGYLDKLDRETFKADQKGPGVWSKAMHSFGSYGDNKYGDQLIGEIEKMYKGIGQKGMKSWWPGTNERVAGTKTRLNEKLMQLYQARGYGEDEIKAKMADLEKDHGRSEDMNPWWQY